MSQPAPAGERQSFPCSQHEIRLLLRLRQLEHSGDAQRIVYDVRAHVILERTYTRAERLDWPPKEPSLEQGA